MSKLKKNFSKEVIYSINDVVEFDWIGAKDIGTIERISTEDREFPIYFIRSERTTRLYNMGAEQGVTSAGYIVSKISSQSKKAVKKPIVKQETSDDSVELKKAVKKQKDFLNHFFEV
jgi:hypothetical protein